MICWGRQLACGAGSDRAEIDPTDSVVNCEDVRV